MSYLLYTNPLVKPALLYIAPLRSSHNLSLGAHPECNVWFDRFEAAVDNYTAAISSLEELVHEMRLRGDEGVNSTAVAEQRKHLAPLYWSRAVTYCKIGRYCSAVADCGLAWK